LKGKGEFLEDFQGAHQEVKCNYKPEGPQCFRRALAAAASSPDSLPVSFRSKTIHFQALNSTFRAQTLLAAQRKTWKFSGRKNLHSRAPDNSATASISLETSCRI
jgi:hypothetical protein